MNPLKVHVNTVCVCVGVPMHVTLWMYVCVWCAHACNTVNVCVWGCAHACNTVGVQGWMCPRTEVSYPF